MTIECLFDLYSEYLGDSGLFIFTQKQFVYTESQINKRLFIYLLLYHLNQEGEPDLTAMVSVMLLCVYTHAVCTHLPQHSPSTSWYSNPCENTQLTFLLLSRRH